MFENNGVHRRMYVTLDIYSLCVQRAVGVTGRLHIEAETCS